MSQYSILCTEKQFTEETALRINEAIQAIDDEAEFRGPLSIPGSQTTGWLERPNDGTNDYSRVRERNAQMAAIVRNELDK